MLSPYPVRYRTREVQVGRRANRDNSVYGRMKSVAHFSETTLEKYPTGAPIEQYEQWFGSYGYLLSQGITNLLVAALRMVSMREIHVAL